MPKGPFGFPRLTDFGPLTDKSDMDVVGEHIESDGLNKIPEAAMKRTIIELNDITGAGYPDITVSGVSKIFERGVTAEYNGESIDVSFEPVVLSASDKKYVPYLKGLVAHEYVHHILNSNHPEAAMIGLWQEDLFDLSDMDETVEYYDFHPDDYRDYDGVEDFIEHFTSFHYYSDSRPVEGAANIVAVRYARITFERYNELKTEVRSKAGDVGDMVMSGEPDRYTHRENWEIDW